MIQDPHPTSETLTWLEKVGLAFAFVFSCFIVYTFASDFGLPSKRYGLPNGQIVECTSMVETSKGNFHLSGCKDGNEYYVQGTVEVLR